VRGPASISGMNAATANALRPEQARSVKEILRGLGALWDAPALAGVGVVANPRLSRTLGRLVGRPGRIELGPRALVTMKRLREVVTHEAAHAALVTREGASPQAPHGTEWRERMALAGYPEARGAHWRCHRATGQSPQQSQKQQPTARTHSAVAYEHWCPVCHSSRLARRPVKAWRCAACVAAGLDGRLEITRRTRRPKPAR
jgi:predicted SprT family Zn-dependent metalloprotease